jgi:hypothetical protein
MDTLYQTEIIRLHQFFEDWFNGRIPQTDAGFAPFPQALAPAFHIISPGGELSDRESILNRVRRAYNTQRGTRIWIQNGVLRWQQADLALVTYEEWQEGPSATARGRLSTVVFQHQADALAWLHVHETWL